MVVPPLHNILLLLRIHQKGLHNTLHRIHHIHHLVQEGAHNSFHSLSLHHPLSKNIPRLLIQLWNDIHQGSSSSSSLRTSCVFLMFDLLLLCCLGVTKMGQQPKCDAVYGDEPPNSDSRTSSHTPSWDVGCGNRTICGGRAFGYWALLGCGNHVWERGVETKEQLDSISIDCAGHDLDRLRSVPKCPMNKDVSFYHGRADDD